MVKVQIEITKKMIIELPINSYSDIYSNNMSLEESDSIIEDMVAEKYGFFT